VLFATGRCFLGVLVVLNSSEANWTPKRVHHSAIAAARTLYRRVKGVARELVRRVSDDGPQILRCDLVCGHTGSPHEQGVRGSWEGQECTTEAIGISSGKIRPAMPSQSNGLMSRVRQCAARAVAARVGVSTAGESNL
jgi:hypothetical protein